MLLRTLCSLSILCTALFSSPAFGEDTHDTLPLDLQAEKLLSQMNTFLNNLGQFTFSAENAEDQLLSSGQQLQFAHTVHVTVRRPNRFRADIHGDIYHQQLFFDGKTVTLLDKNHNYYGTLKAPPTIESALDFALESFGLRAPLADFIHRKNTVVDLPPSIKSGYYVGLHDVRGVPCHHLAFRQDDVDWQIWIENSDTPVPRKIIISQKHVTGAPQFSALLSDWTLAPQLPDREFIFEPPHGSKKIEFLPANE
jgi:hypothetical protein